MDRLYLDYAATTPLDPGVLKQMTPYFSEIFGNPSSSHYFGQQAEAKLEDCRARVGRAFGATPEEVIFTASGSEGDNLAVRGTALAQRKLFGKNTILTTQVEHPAVYNTAVQLRDEYGFKLIELRVDNFGQIILEELESQINNQSAVVSLMYANNEIGTINPINEIARMCRSKGVVFHTDAVQAAAYLPINLKGDNIDLLSFTSHKFYGPKGVGALIKRDGLPLLSHTSGGKQENEFRAGTHNLPGIVGLTAALEMAIAQREEDVKRFTKMRDKIITFVKDNIPGSFLTGHPTYRLPNHASFVFEGINGNDLVIMLDMAGYACSSGSACKVGDPKPSKVLLALGIKPELAIGSLRITLGRATKESQLDAFLETLKKSVKKLRK